MLSFGQKFIKKLTLPAAMLIFVALFAVDFFYVPRADSSGIQVTATVAPAPIVDKFPNIKISNDFSPRIDSEAAAIFLEKICQTLPGELWIFLLAAYLFLMLFNLFYDFKREQSIHPVRRQHYLEQDDRRPVRLTSNGVHWFWESLYTILALFGWYVWDECHQNIWFPLYVLKTGTIVYLFYLYLFYEKKEMQLEK